MKRYWTVPLALAALAASTSVDAANLIIVGGKLAGATGVDVSGSLYNVEFVDGTCSAVFGGCNSSADFAFNSVAGASAATQALRDQILLGIYRADPSLTVGCESSTCGIIVPYAVVDPVTLSYSYVVNLGGGTPFQNPTYTFPLRLEDLSAMPSNVYARFALASGAVPEPATWAMMIGGFGAIGGAMRYRRRKVSVSFA